MNDHSQAVSQLTKLVLLSGARFEITLSGSTSLNSEFTRFQHENNRRYHAYRAGHYLFPNDEGELDRMDLEHHNQGLMLGALHLAPLNTPNEILELGTGSGIWAIDMADQYPSASVLGIDLSPVQPDWVPPNLKFEVDDFESEWTFGSDRFDLIYARQLLCSVSDYPLLYRRIFDATKPGGWFEISEIEVGVFSDDGTVPEDSASCQWARLLGEATQKLGRSIPPVTQYKKFMEDAGFVDVQELYLKRPTNDWPKDRRLKEIGRVSSVTLLLTDGSQD